MIFIGDDWAESHHDVYLMDEALIAGHAEEPEQAVVGIETDRGLWVAALVAAAPPPWWPSRTSPTATPWECWIAHPPPPRAPR
jgi:hypothetical protein